MLRETTFGTDIVLGLSDHVHFYLLRRDMRFEELPILATQLLPSTEPPFPHIALERETVKLTDEDCTLCLWNIAVSRPTVPDVCKGGNWTRGTNPARVHEVWRAFRSTSPTIEKARGCWNDKIEVPTLKGDQIARHLRLLPLAPRGMPELLLASPVALGCDFTVWTFSEEDRAVVAQAVGDSESMTVRCHIMPSYDARTPRTHLWRQRAEAYFNGKEPFPRDPNFDGRRSLI